MFLPTQDITGHGYAANASDAAARGITAVCDMDCGTTYGSAGDALHSGALRMEALDAAIGRTLAMRFRLGEFDREVPFRDLVAYGPSQLDTAAARALALRAAEESIVLLRNVPLQNGTRLPLLPLLAGAALTIGVLGPTANPLYGTPDDKNDYCPAFQVSPLVGLRAAAALDSRLDVRECLLCCAPQTGHEIPVVCDAKRSAAFAATVDVAVLCLGTLCVHLYSSCMPAV